MNASFKPQAAFVTCVATWLLLSFASANVASGQDSGFLENILRGAVQSGISKRAIIYEQRPRAANPKSAMEASSPYAVDGLALGGSVHFGSVTYDQYQCDPSDQFPGFTWCHQNKQERRASKGSFSSQSILHAADGTAVYINRYIRPAFQNAHDANIEINRLSMRFGKARILKNPEKLGLPHALIASWGAVELVQIDKNAMSILQSGASPRTGILIDFLGDFPKSAKLDLPVYRLSGGAGYVWSASFDERGIGHLRFLAVDASALSGGIVTSVATHPSFSCGSATTVDEVAICGSKELSALDNIVAAGFNFVRLNLGTAEARKIGARLLSVRQSCRSDHNCIMEAQLYAIHTYQKLGAPVQIPNSVASPTAPPETVPIIQLPVPTEFPAEKRIALVIGNSAYRTVHALRNPGNDAHIVAEAFRRLGFTEVLERHDLTLNELSSELKAFGDLAANADWAVIYYAGHGIELSGVNYLIPVDAELASAAHVEEEAISLDRVESKVEDARKLRLVILDACRDNPFAQRVVSAGGTRSVGRGLARVEPISGVLIAYSARDGHIALDGDEINSPFAQALVQKLEEPGLEISLLFRKVRDAVMDKTHSQQEPFTYGSLGGEPLYFKIAAGNVALQ
jgi:uncharacterized protein